MVKPRQIDIVPGSFTVSLVKEGTSGSFPYSVVKEVGHPPHWYSKTQHAELSRRDPRLGLGNWSRWELQQYLEGEGFAVYGHEDTEVLRLAVRLHAGRER